MKMTFKELFLFSPHEKKAKIITFENGINVITSNQEDGTDRGKSVVMRSLYHALGAESFFEAKWDRNAYREFLEENGFKVKTSAVLKASIPLMYTESVIRR